MLKSIGTVRYKSNWWIWLDVDYELGRYLRHLYLLARRKCCKLGRPSQQEHITVVSSHEKNGLFEQLWMKHEGREIEFWIDLDKPKTNGNAIWHPIISPDLENLRIELGLTANRNPDLHFCCGYLYQGKTFYDY